MALAQQLAALDALCSRAPGAAAPGSAAQDHGTALLPGTADGEHGERSREQCEAERDALTLLLTARWGAPHRFGLQGLPLRAAEYGEDIPEPWRSLAGHVGDVHAWHTGGRWVVLGVSRRGDDLPCRLLAAVTPVDPP
ncbi:hypothetical protein [Streptomyces sp. NPDC050560]|uniref:hypothetical protein n=1 Tax=Streptomyces sp. NPDC050560 TaxID=3365630 RepID=UPI00378D7F82